MRISLVIPVYNEEIGIPIFYEAVRSFTYFEKYDVEIVFINDGSTDSTELIINNLSTSDNLVLALSFTRNFGKESALIAGLEYANGDVVIPIDVDLQDPIEVIPELIKRWQSGADMVLAKRINRSSDSYLKRITSSLFYKFHSKISSPKIEGNVGDFRLMSRHTVEIIKSMPERNLFMKGLLSWSGGTVKTVEYTRPKRVAGTTKFNGWELWNLALEGITSFSTVPLRMWTYIGTFIAGLSFLYGMWMIIKTLVWGSSVAGYPSIMVSILFLGGIQLI